MSKQLCALVCAALLVAHASCADEVELPRSIKVCQRDTPDYTSCLRLAIQESWMTFVKGIPELELPPLDPLVIEYIENEFNYGEVQGRFVLRDVKTYGMAKTNFLAVRPDFTDGRMSMEVDLDMPKIFIDGNYKADGTVGPYQIGGKGYFNISMEGISVTWGMEGRVENDRWVIEHFHINPELEKMKVYFTDLFNGNEDMNKAAMNFVNEYWPMLYKGMLPIIEKQWDSHITEFINRVFFSKIPISKLFP